MDSDLLLAVGFSGWVIYGFALLCWEDSGREEKEGKECIDR